MAPNVVPVYLNLQSIQQSEDVSICLIYIAEVQAMTQLCEAKQL